MVLDHGVANTCLSTGSVMTVPPAMETCGMPARCTSPRMAMVAPVPVAPMMATTSSCSMSRLAAATACASSVASSSMMTSTGRPLMPPASLIFLTSISMRFFSGSPRPAYVPVSERMAPILIGSPEAAPEEEPPEGSSLLLPQPATARPSMVRRTTTSNVAESPMVRPRITQPPHE